ncbi:MAG: tetratricopeptide repeat protein [Planctomycetes bacterium]|nr:tetratricopeptide repeat protein [Planctomycetota bacterium]
MRPFDALLRCLACAALAACAAVEQLAPSADEYETCDGRSGWEEEFAARRGDPSGLREYLIATIRRCPDLMPAHLELLAMVGADGAHDPAVLDFYATWSGRLGSPVPNFVKARMARNDRDRLEALEAALALDPSFYFAYLDLAEVWARSDRFAKVVDAYEKASRAKPGSWRAQLGLARSLHQIGRTEDAAAAFAIAMPVIPDDAPELHDASREYAAMLVYELERPDAAIVWLDRLLARAPDDVGLIMDRAAACWRSGERDRAVALYRRVLELDPQEVRAALNIGNLYFGRPGRAESEKRRDWPAARVAYRYFLAHATDGDAFDVTDRTVSVPLRLRLIDELLGALPAGTPTPRVGDL